jgi:hypothetical protein
MIKNERSDLTGDEWGVAGSGPAGRQQWRTIVAVLLIVVGCVLAPLVGGGGVGPGGDDVVGPLVR